MIIKAGTFLSFCGGEYSDKWTSSPFRVLLDIDQEEVSNKFLAEHKAAFEALPEKEQNYGYDAPQPFEIAAWLTKNGYVEDVEDATEWYVGSYRFGD
jgi:hypothetical protein